MASGLNLMKVKMKTVLSRVKVLSVLRVEKLTFVRAIMALMRITK